MSSPEEMSAGQYFSRIEAAGIPPNLGDTRSSEKGPELAEFQTFEDTEIGNLIDNFKKKYGMGSQYRNLSRDERWERRRDFAGIKRLIKLQREGISGAIMAMRQRVEENPDVPASELASIIDTFRDSHHLTGDQLEELEAGVERFATKHAVVRRYTERYPSAEALFEIAFGFQPKGKVDLVKGPVTICFRCHNPQDYGAAFKAATPSATQEQQDEHTKGSGGLAFKSVKEPDLAEVITLENAGIHGIAEPMKTSVPVRVEYPAPIPQGVRELDLPPQTPPVKISIFDKGDFYISGLRSGIQITHRPEGQMNTTAVFAAHEVQTKEGKRFEDLHHKGVLRGTLSFTFAGKGKERLSLVIDQDGTRLLNRAKNPLGTIVERRLERKLIPPSSSAGIIRHEEQHQFNKLFQPIENTRNIVALLRQTAGRAQTPEEAADRATKALALNARRSMGIDTAARDEILAFYREGRPLGAIATTLKTSPLYDYKRIFKNQIPVQLEHIKNEIQTRLRYVLYEELQPTKSGKALMRVGAIGLVPADAEKIQAALDFTLGPLYERQIDESIAAIKLLERKGYNHDQVLGLLTQEPIRRWPRFADQMAYIDKRRPEL